MSHAKNKVEWCLKKAERELKETGKHRGLAKANPNLEKARGHITKAEHYLEATGYLKKGNFSDISASTVFYSMYHCLLAIAAKFGYDSGNQECTFALVHSLIEDGKIDFEKELLDKISSLDIEKKEEQTTIDIRELYQYGTSLSIKDDLYKELFELAKKVIAKTKEIMER
ncbi:MAG: HEPN domain-containing protein [Candidatus Woesearchaeota archaeon]|nr:HEPN domain-containing protein [Candidatus Woesearchaeota archaeon]